MTPIVNGLEAEFEGQVAVQRFNVANADGARIQNHYNLRGHPSFAVIDAAGEATAVFFGVVADSSLRGAMMAVEE